MGLFEKGKIADDYSGGPSTPISAGDDYLLPEIKNRLKKLLSPAGLVTAPIETIADATAPYEAELAKSRKPIVRGVADLIGAAQGLKETVGGAENFLTRPFQDDPVSNADLASIRQAAQQESVQRQAEAQGRQLNAALLGELSGAALNKQLEDALKAGPTSDVAITDNVTGETRRIVRPPGGDGEYTTSYSPDDVRYMQDPSGGYLRFENAPPQQGSSSMMESTVTAAPSAQNEADFQLALKRQKEQLMNSPQVMAQQLRSQGDLAQAAVTAGATERERARVAAQLASPNSELMQQIQRQAIMELRQDPRFLQAPPDKQALLEQAAATKAINEYRENFNATYSRKPEGILQ